MFRTGFRRPLVGLITLISCVIGSMACGPQQPPVTVRQSPTPCNLPQAIQLVVQGSDRLNLDDRGRSLPTLIRIYQLKEITRLERAQFEDVWLRARDTLGEDLLQADEFWVYPNQRASRQFQRKREASYVVGMAVVRHPAGISWRSIFELPPDPSDTRCAALQRNPNENPARPPDPRYYFFVEDYHIEGGDDPEAPPPPPATGDGGLQLPNLNNLQVPDPSQQLPQMPNTQLPQSPSLPSAPQMPQGPTLPTLPQKPAENTYRSFQPTTSARDIVEVRSEMDA